MWTLKQIIRVVQKEGGVPSARNTRMQPNSCMSGQGSKGPSLCTMDRHWLGTRGCFDLCSRVSHGISPGIAPYPVFDRNGNAVEEIPGWCEYLLCSIVSLEVKLPSHYIAASILCKNPIRKKADELEWHQGRMEWAHRARTFYLRPSRTPVPQEKVMVQCLHQSMTLHVSYE